MRDNWIAEDRDHLLRMEKEKTRQVQEMAEARVEITKTVGIVVGILAVLVLLVGAIWTGVQNNAQRESVERTACLESGGTMFDLAAGGSVCLRLADDEATQ